MALIEQVRTVIERLVEHGWAELMRRHGLELRAGELERELLRELPGIDRFLPGFEDFTSTGRRAIEPGNPAASLLYHALASPNVHPSEDGQPAAPEAYPTLEELDVLENYLFGLGGERVDLTREDLVVAVFAYQYRPGSHSAHGYHADLAFSRTGVARVGTHPAHYRPALRSFWPVPEGVPGGLAVLPARYGAFLAVMREPEGTDAILGPSRHGDVDRVFFFPLHKLFPGTECLPGYELRLDFLEYHRTEKLRRVHTVGRIPLVDGFDLEAPPFVRDSRTSGDLVEPVGTGASVLIHPRAHGALVRLAVQENRRSGRREVVRFPVPPESPDNRFSTSLLLPATGVVRNAPEYVNIRHRVVDPEASAPGIEDLNGLPAPAFTETLARGGYEAAHYEDDSCDGVVEARVEGLPRTLPDQPAYSLVTAPDFFPLADQVEISTWVRERLPNLREHFRQGSPDPLSEGRRPANLDLERPSRPNTRAFTADDDTVTAVVGPPPLERRESLAPLHRSPKHFVSFLPDAAADEFAPGWDVSLASEGDQVFYAAYGLGSPFPEDAKLCAALNSFWPAVAPDASRTFRISFAPTAIPMLDAELGYHPRHPRVQRGEVPSHRGWDGEYGPFLETVDGEELVNHAALDRSDYVSNTLAHRFDLQRLAPLHSDELIRRMEALRRCILALPPRQDVVSTTSLWLIVVEPVEDWARVPERADAALRGPGYLYVFANVLRERDREDPEDLARRRVPVRERFTCQLSADRLFYRVGEGTWRTPAGGPPG